MPAGPSPHPTDDSRRSKQRRAGAAALVLAVTAGLLCVTPLSWADGPADPLAAGNAAHASDTAPTSAEDQAFAQAAATGQPVAITALTTAFSSTMANPDGTLTQTQSPTPQRVEQNGVWNPLDATLTPANGGYSPKASSEPLTLSAGGNGPMAVMTGPKGQQLSLTAPFPLPAPTISGDTALYPDVAAGIDLQVQASDTGGVSTVLIVKTAAASADPILKNLSFTTAASGVTVTADSGGNLNATDPAGTVVFHAPAPLMWDSSTTTPPPSNQSSHSTARMLTVEAASSPTPSPSASTAPAPTTTSSAEGPGSGARTATIPDTVTGNSLDLQPDQALLSSTATRYPVYVDPSWVGTDLGLDGYTWVQSADPTTTNYEHSGTADTDFPGVGTCGSYADGDSCSPSDTERTFYQFDISGLNGAIINSAVLKTSEYTSADFSCTNTYPVSVSVAGSIGPNTDWNNQPSSTYATQQAVGGSGDANCHDNVPVNFTVTTQLNNALGASTLDFALTGNESNANAFKRFTHSASLSVQYDRTPWQPQTPHTTPLEPQFAATGTTTESCGSADSTTWGWIGATGTSLNASVDGPLSGQPLAGWFNIWDDSQSGYPSIASGYTGFTSGGPSGNNVSFPLSGKLQDGHAYGWHAYSTDGVVPMSAGTAICAFRVDLTPPVVTMPTTATGINTATQFPPSGSGATTALFAGQTGTVPFSATDPAPTGYSGTGSPQVSGLACLRWGWDASNMGADTWQCGSALPSGTLSITPTHWGTNILYVQAEDNAGNSSAITSYPFYVPWNRNGPTPVFGDTTGDAVPDVLIPGTDGNLYAHSLPTSSSTSPTSSLAANTGSAPTSGTSWSNYQTTHRGSLTGGKNVDDLIVHKSGDPTLNAYLNPGNTDQDGLFDQHETLNKPACADPGNTGQCTTYANDWSTTLQIAALGDVSTTNLDTTKKFLNRTGLVTEETNAAGDAALWFYPVVSDSTLGNPTLLSPTGWKGWDLISPGDWADQGHPGLWARNRTTGQIDAYTFTINPSATQPGLDGLGDPITIGPFPAVSAISTATVLSANGLPAATYPLIGSEGDLTATTGIADLWATSASGQIDEWTGITSDGKSDNPVTSFATTAQVIGSTSGTNDQWLLPSAQYPGASVGQDAANLNSATGYATNPSTGATTTTAIPFAPVTDGNSLTQQAATFDGTTNYLSAKTALNTTNDYTVSAWVDLSTGFDTTKYDTALCQRDASGARCSFYLQYSPPLGGWTLVSPSNDSATPTSYAHAGSNVTATAGQWTHLVGVFSATTKTMTLYVNGKFAGAASNNTAWNGTGPLLIGGADGGTNASTTPSLGDFNGSIANVRTYPTALTLAQIQALN